MQFVRKTALAAGMIGVVAQIGVAQGAPAAAHTAAQQTVSVDSAYKKLAMHAYPAKGQSAEQQKTDTHECYAWAKGQTGFDPATAVAVDPAAAAAAAQQQTADATAGAAVVGGAKGAAGGALIGAAAGDAGKGAAIGAATGAVVGRSRKKRAEKQAGANAAQAATQPNPQVESFKKAIGACLEGRGYTFSK